MTKETVSLGKSSLELLAIDSKRPVMSRAFLSLIRDLRHAKGVILRTTRARPLRRTMREANRLRHSRFASLTEEERATLEKLKDS